MAYATPAAFRQALEARLNGLARKRGVEPIQDLAGAPYGGARFPVDARLAGRVFARFHVDVGTGDTIVEPVESVQGEDWLEFAGVHTIPFPIISREQQFAEKLHAYTLHRGGRPNTRVRDLLDMYLLLQAGVGADRTFDAVCRVFDCRKTHNVPESLPPPPEAWTIPFAVLANECHAEISMDQAHALVKSFLLRGKARD